jgi:hypothetical protein
MAEAIKLTICLVTRGRESYLEQILKSFEALIVDKDIKFLIVDNGASRAVSERLNAWQSRNLQSIKLVRFEVNDSRQSAFWAEVIHEGTDWAVFPSDDDEFRPEIINEWRLAVSQNSKLVAFAAAAAIIDVNGKLTGEVLRPSAEKYKTKFEQVASALNEPPFLWPSLFFRVSKIPESVPNSRFVFDWWIGINLLIAGDVVCSNSVGVNYRVHAEQESFLAPHRRKYFEAQFWIDDFLRNQDFLDWISSLSDANKLVFYKLVLALKPIYGDPNFSKLIIATLTRVSMRSACLLQFEQEIMSLYAYENGILLKDGEVKNLLFSMHDISNNFLGNIRVEFVEGVCDLLKQASGLLIGGFGRSTIQVSCNHSRKSLNSIKIDCSILVSGKPDINADMIINSVTTSFENENRMNFTITSGERVMINLLRRWKSKLPPLFKQFLKKLRNSNSS